ncbi:unnamed protein product [Rhodiola kirilowii]
MSSMGTLLDLMFDVAHVDQHDFNELNEEALGLLS